MAKCKAPTWSSVKSMLSEKESSELLKLVSDLYSLSEENRRFVSARYSEGSNNIEPYKKIISNSLYPDICEKEPIKLGVGKKAISDYFKATKNEHGKLELMVYYLETGTKFSRDYGDINEAFYSSLESMFDKILSELKKKQEHALSSNKCNLIMLQVNPLAAH